MIKSQFKYKTKKKQNTITYNLKSNRTSKNNRMTIKKTILAKNQSKKHNNTKIMSNMIWSEINEPFLLEI